MHAVRSSVASVSQNNLGDDGLAKIIQGLKHNTKLTFLMCVGQPHSAYISCASASTIHNGFCFYALYCRTQHVRMGHYNDPLSPALALELARLMEGNAALDVK